MEQVDLSGIPQPVLADHPEWVRLYRKAWELAAAHVKTGKNGRAYMDSALDQKGRREWVWDTSFMSMFCRYAPDTFPGIQSLDNFYDFQRDDGYIGMAYDLDTDTEPWPDRINPPLFAWVEWEYFVSTGDSSRFERVVGHIERLMDWIDRNRLNAPHERLSSRGAEPAEPGESAESDKSGDSSRYYRLYYFTDCGSSGMDDSPRTPRARGAGKYYDWIDLSSQMALSFRMLGRINAVLGRDERSSYWENRARELGGLINAELWCEKTRFYHDRQLSWNFVSHKTVASFWPMLAGICPDDRRDALVEHLLDERQFNRHTPVPTLSADDPNYSPEGIYWCGGVWAPTNYMIVRGLAKAGRLDVAHEIAMKYVGVLARTCANYQPGTLWENYCPEEDKPGLKPHTLQPVTGDFVGWTGLGPIAMLIENIIGLEVNVPDRRVEWNIRLAGEHGVRGLALGVMGSGDFLCRRRTSPESPAEVEIRCDNDIIVQVTRGSETRTVRLAGRSAVSLTV